MSSTLRATMTLREARAIQQLIRAGEQALGYLAPDTSCDLIAAFDIGVHDLSRKQADARAMRAARKARPTYPPMRNLVIDGYTISATKGDWIDASPDPDYRAWIALTEEREGDQRELRRNVWRVSVLNGDPYGPLHLATDCTVSGEEREIETLARHLVAPLQQQRSAA